MLIDQGMMVTGELNALLFNERDTTQDRMAKF